MANANYTLINEIMSNQSMSTIVLTKSDGEHIGFISDLANNYQKTFWINVDYCNTYSFPISFAKKILQDSEALEKLLKFNYCKSDFSKDTIIINSVLESISKYNYDCLLVIDNVEKFPQYFDMRIIESILKNAPKNLKVVVISEVFPELNYNIFDKSAPKLIHEFEIETVPFDKSIINEPFSNEDWEFLSCIASIHPHVEKKVAEKLYPGRGVELLEYVSHKYRSVVMAKGGDLYYVSEKLDDFIKAEKNIDRKEIAYNYDWFLYEFFSSEDVEEYILALNIALDYQNINWIDSVVKKIVDKPQYGFFLEEFLSKYDLITFNPLNKYFYARYLCILSDIIHARYDSAYIKARALIKEKRIETNLYNRLIFCILESLHRLGKKMESAEYLSKVLKERLEQNDENALIEVVDALERLPRALTHLKIGLDIPLYKKYEKIILNEKNKNCFWYYGIMQSCVGCNMQLGNYKRGIELLKLIKEEIPYYIVPHNLISAYYFAGDMELAQRMAEEAIQSNRWHGIKTNLSDAYILLGMVKFYFNKAEESIKYLNDAIDCAYDNESTLYNAVSIRAITCAEMGLAEYGKDIALLYAQKCEISGSKYYKMLSGAISYCYRKLKDKENAIKYAKKCIESTATRSAYWLLSSAIILDYLIEEDEIKVDKTLISKFLTASRNHGMDILAVVCRDCFKPILDYAVKYNMEKDYIDVLKRKMAMKSGEYYAYNTVNVKFMGTTNISVNGNELIWKTRKAKELFLLYVLKGEEGIDRNELINTFWNDYLYVSAINNLKTTNNIIRNTLSANDISFKLEYSNSKYTLKLSNKYSDYEVYNETIADIKKEKDLHKKIKLFNKALYLYNSGFALDINVPYFNNVRDKVKDELGILILNIIKDMVKAGEILDAKQYVQTLKKMQVGFDYVSILNEIDKRLIK